MKRRVTPDVPVRFGEAAHANNPAMLRSWRFFRQNMKQRELISDVLNLNVVGNDVAFQPVAECFTKLRLGIH